MFKEVKITDGISYKKGEAEELSPPSSAKKIKIRHQIESEVFDIHDSVADNAKWLSLLTTLMSRMFDTFTDTQKGRLSIEDRALIEGVFGMFKNTNTRGDVQFAQEGPAMIEKIMSRQAQIGDIVK